MLHSGGTIEEAEVTQLCKVILGSISLLTLSTLLDIVWCGKALIYKINLKISRPVCQRYWSLYFAIVSILNLVFCVLNYEAHFNKGDGKDKSDVFWIIFFCLLAVSCISKMYLDYKVYHAGKNICQVLNLSQSVDRDRISNILNELQHHFNDEDKESILHMRNSRYQSEATDPRMLLLNKHS